MTDDSTDFKSAIKEAIQEFMAVTDGAAKIEKAESMVAEIEDTISQLTAALSAKAELAATVTADNDTLKEQVAEIEARITELTEALAAAEKLVETTEERASAAEKTLAGLAAERRLETRVHELAAANVAAPEAKLEKQKARIRELSDEEFASYLGDRVELRAQMVAELTEQAATETADDDTTPEEGTVTVPAPDIDGAAREDAAVILDVELVSEDTQAKFDGLGNALATMLRKNSEK